jgi:CDP-2,3-bis-(O-geranylgeranyl)-sn-glycerol synthase
MDFQKNFIDGKRFFGDGKTWQGFFAGTSIGWLIGIIYCFTLPNSFLNFYQEPLFYLSLGILSGVGALTGDAFGSFIKRRLDIDKGAPFFLIDQLPFLYITLLILWFFGLSIINLYDILWLTVLTYLVHRVANIIANKFGWKRVPW